MKNTFFYISIIATFLSCSARKSYVWVDTQENVKLWVEESQSSYSFSWNGGNIEGVANGIGTLVIIQNGQVIDSSKQNIYYGAIDNDGIEKISPSETYIGETESKKYSGFGVLIKQQEVLIGHFVKSKANGYCSYFRDGKIVYRGMWKKHQLHGEGIQYTQDDTISGIWDKGKLVLAKLSKDTKVGRFSGYIENNLPNGQGSMEYFNGWNYTGNWKNGLWNGEGELTTPDFAYTGEWSNGKPNGEGVVEYSSGEYYDGYWEDGKREGWGDALNSDGSYYVGEWLAGEYGGIGTLYFADNSVYDGQWQCGLQHGLGTYSSDSFTYVGEWEEGWINGEGRIDYSNGDYYEGHYIENKRFGLGYYHFNNGNSYEGEFVDDLFQGLGIFYFNDGSIYEGEFLNGKICGDGTYYFVDGNDTIAITAQWTGTTEFPNQASILFSNGDIYEGEIRNGKPTENGIWYPNESSWFRNKLVSANDCYKLHKETIDKAILITSVSLLVVATAAATIASAGAGTPALAASVSTLTTVANTANTVSAVVNAADIAITLSSSAIDEDWEGVSKEVAINAAFIIVPKGITKALQSNPARKMAVKLSESAAARVLRKSAITITKSKPFKKMATIVIKKSGKIKKAFISSTRNNLEKFSKSQLVQRMYKDQYHRALRENKKLVARLVKKQASMYKNATKINKKAKILNDIKNRLDNIPDPLEKQRLFDELPNDVKNKLEQMWGKNSKYRNLPQAGKNKGHWTGEPGNSYYHIDLNKIPKSNGYNNLRNLSMEEILKENELLKLGIKFTNGYPDFSKISKGVVEVDYEPFINDILNGNRETLHEAAFEKYAQKLGMSIDEVQVFKGNKEPVSRLAKQWGCSEKEVWKRCNNPNQRQLVWHEEPDCKTLRLVPIEVHANVTHAGGISMAQIIFSNKIFYGK